MSATLLFCIWLIPAPVDYQHLSQEIIGLSQQLDFPSFEPHTTLFCGHTSDLTKIKRQFETLFQDALLITLKTNGVTVQSEAQRNFFIQLQPTKLLKKLHSIAHTLDENSTYSFEPHVSLTYGVPLEKLTPFAAFYVVPNTVTFDKIGLMAEDSIVDVIHLN